MADFLLDCNHLSTAIRKVSVLRDRIHQARRAGHRFISSIPVVCELEAGIQLTAKPDEYRRRLTGADPIKLTRQLSRHGLSTAGMPPPWVHRDPSGLLMVMDGVTRATRVAKWLPGQLIRVVVTSDDPTDDFSKLPTIGDTLP
jgi:hypothetical protein